MPSLEDFLKQLDENPTTALTAYNFEVDQASLDLVPHAPEVEDGFQIDAAIEDKGGSRFLIRAAVGTDTTLNTLRIWYLPWKKWDGVSDMTGVSRTTLDGKGSGIFLTSQLDACRFTVQDQSGDGKKVTVLHLAGNFGTGKPGAHKREGVETKALEGLPGSDRRRRYSFGQYSTNPKFNQLPTTGTRTYYSGGMATVLGVRGRTGAWAFYGQRYETRGDITFDKVQTI